MARKKSRSGIIREHLKQEATSWDYLIDFGKYADGLETYMLVKFWTGDDSYAQKPGLKETRDLFLDTVTVATDYEGRGGPKRTQIYGNSDVFSSGEL